MLLWVGLGEELLEVLLIHISSHEGWGAGIHKDLSELLIFLLNNILDDLIVLVEVGLNEVELLILIPETGDLLLTNQDRISAVRVNEVIPELLLECGVR